MTYIDSTYNKGHFGIHIKYKYIYNNEDIQMSNINTPSSAEYRYYTEASLGTVSFLSTSSYSRFSIPLRTSSALGSNS